MASLIAKRIRGHSYYYAREAQRVNGRPKIVWQKYLGRANDIVARLQSTPSPSEAMVSDFAGVAALYDLSQRLHLTEHVDRHVPKRGKGPGIGTYLLVAVLNRCLAPCSKARIADWFQGTVLRRLIAISPHQLTSQRYWDNMDRVCPEAIAAIEQDITRQMVREFEVDLSRVLFDATNFFTFIDSFTERCTLAQRGKSKEGRAALRIVGLALLVSSDGHLPLLHHTYKGNQPDAPNFASLTEQLAARCRALSDDVEHITIVFDKGNNSTDNLAAVGETPFHFIGSLVPTQHPDLLAVQDSSLHSLAEDGIPGVRAYRTTRKVFGVERTVLVTYNENLFVAQMRTLLREISKRQQRLVELQSQLLRRRRGEMKAGKAPTVPSTIKKIEGWLSARHLKELFPFEVTEEEGLPKLSYHFDHGAWERLQATLLGKTILFTDNGDWSDADIVHGYRSQHHVERGFRCMKDPHCIALRPQNHWTDQKIRVHVFICVLALMLTSLLERELRRHGFNLSIREVLNKLGQIREVGAIYPDPKGKEPTIRLTLSQMSQDQRALYEALDLDRYRPVHP
jgi:transposase